MAELNRFQYFNRKTIDPNNEDLMYPIDLEKMYVTTTDGEEMIVTDWLLKVGSQLPTSLRYKHNNRLVDHAKELIDVFRSKGRKGVLDYVKQCNVVMKATNSIIAKSVKNHKFHPLK